VNGTSYPLNHVYVSTQRAFFDRTAEDIRLLFTDAALSAEERSDSFGPARMAREGKLHGIEVVLDARGEPLTGALFVNAFNGMASVSGMHRFEAGRMDADRISGRLYTEGSRTFAGVTYDYDVTFSAAIPRPSTADEIAASLASPPGLAAAAHLAAMRKGMDAFVSTLTADAAAAFRGPDANLRFAALLRETPVDSRVVSLVRDDESRATATVQGHRGDIVIEFTLRLRLEGGVWRVDRRPEPPA
jgi:hypothetical protein